MNRPAPAVQRLHQILLWPLRLLPMPGVEYPPRRPWTLVGAPWQLQEDEYTGSSAQFHERHYREFVTFKPYVQRFLYGEGRNDSCMKVMRRTDVRGLRVQTHEGAAPVTLDVIHIDLYFFDDVDLAILNVEVAADRLDFQAAQQLLYRFGRAFPGGWDSAGNPLHVLRHAEWLDAEGQVLAASDGADREVFIEHVHRHRAPRIAAHWAFLLLPLLGEHAEAPANAGGQVLRYRQIESYRMPQMAYLALDEPRAMGRADFVRLGLAAAPGEEGLPLTERSMEEFESRHCWDQFWGDGGTAPQTRYLVSGKVLVVIGRADAEFFCCRDRGVLAQFRHQHFMVFLIAHFQRAALLAGSDRLVEALRRLDIADPDSVRRFKRAIRGGFESFLRFTHRYWFHSISEQAHARSLYALCVQHLDVEALYAEVKQRITDLEGYLEGDSLRRQANTVVRLTVVTIFGLIGTITTGFLGMNLLAEADSPLPQRIAIFVVTLVLTIWLTFYTIGKSKRLSDFLDAVSDERLSAWSKCKAFFAVWMR